MSTETKPDYGDPAEWDDEWPKGLPAQVAEQLRELGWNVTGWHDSGIEIALPPYHETGVWLAGGGRVWTGLLQSDSSCPNPIQVTANPADPGEIAANADPLLKDIAQQAQRLGDAIALGEVKAFLDALAVNAPTHDALPGAIASVPGPDGAVYLTEHALRVLHAKYERAAKGWRLERSRAETLEVENAELYRRTDAAPASFASPEGWDDAWSKQQRAEADDAPTCRDCGTWPCSRHATDADRAEYEQATGSSETETGGEPCRPCGGQGFRYTPGGEETVDCLLCGGTGVAGESGSGAAQ
jgi:hypothetical protein